MIIGITGKSGTGKNFFAKQLATIQPSLVHVDIDLIGHKVLMEEDIQKRIRETFGDGVFFENHLNRKALADIVFNSRHEHDKLADITWWRMEAILDTILSDGSEGYILNWILLPKTKFFEMCNIKYLVLRDDVNRFSSIMERDNMTMEKILLRDKNSMKYDEKDFDFIIMNKR